jgi:hypothetical protein
VKKTGAISSTLCRSLCKFGRAIQQVYESVAQYLRSAALPLLYRQIAAKIYRETRREFSIVTDPQTL